jgi:alpha-glucosidase
MDVQTQTAAGADGRYYVFDQGLQKNLFQRRSNGELFIPKVWPGESAFVDFTLPESQAWWGDLHRFYSDNGVAGIWNEWNEPSDFVDQSGGNQRDVVSFDEGQKTTHAKKPERLCTLNGARYLRRTRASEAGPATICDHARAYAGIQRYSTMWIGDTNSTWDTLALSLPMYMTLGLSGEPFVGGVHRRLHRKR